MWYEERMRVFDNKWPLSYLVVSFSNFNFLIWNYWGQLIKLIMAYESSWVLRNFLSKLYPHPLSKMAAIAKNGNFFKWLKPVIFEDRISWNLNCSYMVMSCLTYIQSFSVYFVNLILMLWCNVINEHLQ